VKEEERNLLLAVALSLLVLTAWRMLVPPPPPAPAPAAPMVEETRVPPAPGPTVPAPTQPAPEPAAVSAAAERRVEVHTPLAEVAFTNRGAGLVSWRLLGYHDRDERPEELVPPSAGGPRPLELETGRPEIDQLLHTALFVPSEQELKVPPRGSATLSFRFAQGALSAEKSFRFSGDSALVEVTARVVQAGDSLPVLLSWGPGLGNPTPQEMEVRGYQPPAGVALAGTSVEHVPAEKLDPPRTWPHVQWLGVESHYFAALFVPGAGTGELRRVNLPAGEDSKARHASQALAKLAPDQPTLLYVGAKDYPSLVRLGHELVRVVDTGWFGPIVIPLMRLLRFVHGHVGNYGWSIVLLTVLINLAMAPLRHYSIANGVKMAKLSPEMKVIQERYRGIPALDKRREQMQKEMAALYERHGMSMGTQMMMGCLPLFLTMPFLIAFYRVLDLSVELRGAPFLWIADLSQKDPWFLTPALMGVSMFVMQKLTPSAMDPQQQRIMMLMPLMFTTMFFAAPAGLNLYWLSSNVCSLVQQAVTLRLVGAQPSERRRR